MPDSTQVIRNYRTFNGSERRAKAASNLEAGNLVERVSGGIQNQSTDAEVLESVLVATDARGRGFEAGDTYTSGDEVPYANCNAGDLVHLRLAAGESVSGNDGQTPTQLVANGDGTVRAFNADGDGAVVAVADEELDNSGGSSAALLSAEVTR